MDLIWYSAGEQAGLPDVAFMGAEMFSETYTILHLHLTILCVNSGGWGVATPPNFVPWVAVLQRGSWGVVDGS